MIVSSDMIVLEKEVLIPRRQLTIIYLLFLGPCEVANV
jgi:hypothetical protein